MPDREANSAIRQTRTVVYTGKLDNDVSASETPDEELMIRYGRGDAEAFEELYRRYRGPVFRFILRSVCGNRAAAEDLLQEVMMKVIGAAQKYRPTAKFNTWLFRIARNTCIDAARKRKFEPQKRLSDPANSDHEGLTVEDVVGDDGQNPEDMTKDSETGTAVVNILEKMNPDQREVFLLREIEGLSFIEVSQIVGCTESTAKSRMRYALNFMAEALIKQGISP